MPIPPCEETSYRYFYPLFITQMLGKKYFDIMSENYYPDYHDIFPKASDLQQFQRKFRPRYGNLNFCYNFYPDIPRVKSYSIALIEPLLENTGSVEPYPVPSCSDFQLIRRVIMVPNRKGTAFVPETASFYEPLSLSERDLTVEEMAEYEDYFYSKEGGIGYCQLEVSKNPSRWALYWAYNRDAQLFYKCAPTQKEVEESSGMLDAVNEIFVKRCHGFLNPYALDLAPYMADEICRGSGFSFGPEQQEFLEEIVASALHFGIWPHDLEAISIDCANNTDIEDEFLYALAVIVSLRVAKELNRRHVSRGGQAISADFDVIAQTVEEAVKHGRVKIKVKNIGAQDERSIKVYGSGTMGVYNDKENILYLQPIESGASLFSFVNPFNHIFNFLVHECVHVYQDAIKLNASKLETEWQAYRIDMKLRLLFLESFDSALTSSEKEEIKHLFSELDSHQMQNVISHARCMGFGDKVLNLYEDYYTTRTEMIHELTGEIGLELFSGASSFSYEVFLELYRQRHVINKANNYINYKRKYIADNFVERPMMESEGKICAMEISKWINKFGKRLESSRRDYMAFPAKTRNRGNAAEDYLLSLANMIAYTYYLDPSMHDRLIDEYADAFDDLSIDILYKFLARDGIP